MFTDFKRLFKSAVIAFIISVMFFGYNLVVVSYGKLSLIKNNFDISRANCVFLFFLFCILTIIFFLDKEIVFKYRYAIAGAVLLLGVLFKINGSSIGMMHSYFGTLDTDNIFGLSRPERSDEWALFTPMTLAQYKEKSYFPYFSSIVRAGNTDVFLEYGQPVASFLMIFKPFYLGYLILPVEYGMAFFWTGRLIALFMVSFEFARLLTKDNRRLSLVYAFLVAFAPVVQWWFAINCFVEMVIFLQLSLVLLDKYLKSDSVKTKIICALGITVSAGGYILSMYPAWMIPLFYVLLVCIIWVIVRNRTNFKLHKTDVIIMILCVIVLALSFLYVMHKSSETIRILTNTAYPGKRFDTGGGYGLIETFRYVFNVWHNILYNSPELNVCESADFISLFPMGYILYFMYIFKNKKSDLLCNLIIVVSVFLGIYCFIGFSDFLAKITFMGSSVVNRTLPILGFAHTILLIRALYLNSTVEYEGKLKKTIVSLIICLIGSGLIAYALYRNNSGFYNGFMIACEIIALAVLFFGCMNFDNKTIANIWCCFAVFAALLAGLFVNPVRKGLNSIKNSPHLLMIENVVKEDPDAIWLVEDLGLPITNFPIIAGARTVNTTNVYPALERWEAVDPQGEYRDIYNRYAHIMVYFDDDYEGEKFNLLYPDYFSVVLSYDEIKGMNVKYMFTTNDYSNDDRMQLVSIVMPFKIYELK